MAFVSQRNIPLAVIIISPLIIDQFAEIWVNWKSSISNRLVKLNQLNHTLKSARIINVLLFSLLILA
jgi:hypothetical protein